DFDKSGVIFKVGETEQTAVPYSKTLAVGTYNIYADVSAWSADNYYFTTAVGTLTVSPRKLAVEAVETADITKDYDGSVSAVVSAADYRFTTAAGAAASGVVNGDTVNLNFTAAYNSKDVLTADKVNMTALSVDNSNYELVTDTFAIKGSINPAALSVTAKDAAVTYGAEQVPEFEAEYSGFADGEDKSVLSGSLAFSCDYDPNAAGKREVKADGYTITPSGLSSDNYSISFGNGTLTVKKAEIVITADDKSVTYGMDGLPTFTYTHSTPLAYGESYDDVVSGDVTFTCEAQTTNDGVNTVVSSKPDDYAITPVVTSLIADNYSFTAEDGTLTVDKYTVTISGITLKEKVYDGKKDLLAAQVDLSAITFSGMPKIDSDYFTTGTTAAPITVTGAYLDKNVGSDKTVDLTITAGSYLADRCTIDTDASQKTAVADITARPLVITAENKTVKYGVQAPEFTAKFEGDGTAVSGFAANESAKSADVVFSCDYFAPDGGGSYTENGTLDITPTQLKQTSTLDPNNYDITFNKGTLTVTQAQLASPLPTWNALNPGTITWAAVSGIGNVSVEGYQLTLYKDGAEISGSTAAVSADTLSYNYSDAIRENGAGAYTVRIKAVASLVGNDSNKNVIDSKLSESAELCAAEVVFAFAADNVSQNGKGDSITVNTAASYVMIAGEQNV
ncbi:MAG: MBG domain-containing protein, partial [Oscillospiraceae bacterium]